ncbi:methylmalonic aciduria and homocystinuria type c protein homolog [Plakobranchus ocellatus]|uniref:Cyanocobalamin reductase (cyanide-eliminating) n=1 Tax=Plakobranchus ocellatus TaxID=259542 RepID=A0AAV4BIQ0_9GAST|nr:methylmalonic aciduria and homocystinuria type c protein homolog [Plakobranchus ocellatus]
MNVPVEAWHHITARLSNMLCSEGFEVYPFQVGWYNEKVEAPFQFDLPPSTLCYTVVSTPEMFERCLIPFLCKIGISGNLGSMDLLDKCMQNCFNRVREAFFGEEIDVIHDYELSATRRPKVLVQPASHVSGAAYYYTRSNLDPDPFPSEKKIFGVCIHPRYGGWFALRAVIIFRGVQCPDLPYIPPIDCVKNNDKKIELMELFNFHWQDSRYRDIIPVVKRYSEDQQKYFGTLPKDRMSLIQSLIKKFSGIDSSTG